MGIDFASLTGAIGQLPGNDGLLANAQAYMLARGLDLPDVQRYAYSTKEWDLLHGWTFPNKCYRPGYPPEQDYDAGAFRPISPSNPKRNAKGELPPKWLSRGKVISIYSPVCSALTQQADVFLIAEGPLKLECALAHLQGCDRKVSGCAIYGCTMWRAAAKSSEIHPDIAEQIALLPPHAVVLLAFDGDWKNNDNVGREMNNFCFALQQKTEAKIVPLGLPAKPDCMTPGKISTGLDDFVMATGLRDEPLLDAIFACVVEDFEPQESPLCMAKRIGLKLNTKKGGIETINPGPENILLAFNRHEAFKGRITLDEYLDLCLDGVSMVDSDFAQLRLDLQRVAWPSSAPVKADVSDGIHLCAKKHKTNTLADWLRALPPPEPGRDVIRELVTDALPCKDPETAYRILCASLCAMVRRIFTPGYKFDGVLVLVGKGGHGKTKFLEALLPEHTALVGVLPKNDDVIRLLQTKALVILDEMQIFKADKAIQELYSLVSSRNHTFTNKYDRRPTAFPAHTIFMGCTAERHYDRSESGGGDRRFLNVYLNDARQRPGTVIAWIAEHREALLAQAVALALDTEYQTHAIELDQAVCSAREAAKDYDPLILERLGAALANPDIRTIERVPVGASKVEERITLDTACNIAYEVAQKVERRQQDAVTTVLRRLGFERSREPGRRFWVRTRPASECPAKRGDGR